MGRPPKSPDQRGKRVNLYLSADALAALDQLASDGDRSGLVSRLLVEEYGRRKLRESKKTTRPEK